MDIVKNWKSIRTHSNHSFRSNLHVSIASVDKNNHPTATPIGSLFLDKKEQKGFYFEKYPSKLPLHAERNKHICVLIVNSSKWFWIKSLFFGKFDHHPAIKLYGQLSQRRKATEVETTRLNKRMRLTKGLKGNTYLWSNMPYVREVIFTKVDKINLGKMTDSLKG